MCVTAILSSGLPRYRRCPASVFQSTFAGETTICETAVVGPIRHVRWGMLHRRQMGGPTGGDVFQIDGCVVDVCGRACFVVPLLRDPKTLVCCVTSVGCLCRTWHMRSSGPSVVFQHIRSCSRVVVSGPHRDCSSFGWDSAGLCATHVSASVNCRKRHLPASSTVQ
jgi:hypothetical protein